MSDGQHAVCGEGGMETWRGGMETKGRMVERRRVGWAPRRGPRAGAYAGSPRRARYRRAGGPGAYLCVGCADEDALVGGSPRGRQDGERRDGRRHPRVRLEGGRAAAPHR